MPPFLALLLTIGFVGFLWIRESRQREERVSGALWIPLLWFLILATRFVSQWMDIGPRLATPSALEEGSLIDRAVFLSLILSGAFVVWRRGVSAAGFIRDHPWLSAFFFYGLVSLLWSDFPAVAFKRWFKTIGHIVMVLVIFSEREPVVALKVLMRRATFLVVPFSVMTIKYFPEIGRGFSEWSGAALNTGVTLNKNHLGYDCMILGYFFLWDAMGRHFGKPAPAKPDRPGLMLDALMFLMLLWLLIIADSATSFVCFGMGALILLAARSSFARENAMRLGQLLVVGSLAFLTLDWLFGISDLMIGGLGRDPTLTGRTELWDFVLSMGTNPVLGTGWESFWLGERAAHLWQIYWWRPNQAHNGYLETYLNLGWAGVLLLILWLAGVYRKIQKSTPHCPDVATFRMGLLFIIIIFNFVEATFVGMHLLFLMYFLISIEFDGWSRIRAAQRPAFPKAHRRSQWRGRLKPAETLADLG